MEKGYTPYSRASVGDCLELRLSSLDGGHNFIVCIKDDVAKSSVTLNTRYLDELIEKLQGFSDFCNVVRANDENC